MNIIAANPNPSGSLTRIVTESERSPVNDKNQRLTTSSESSQHFIKKKWFNGNYTIIGPLPPPLGGVSVYVRRHAAKLRKEGFMVSIFDFKKATILQRASFCVKVLLDFRPRTFHLHAPWSWALILLIIRPFRKAVIFHDHRWEDVFKSFGFFRKILFKAFLKRCSKLILVGSHIRGMYEDYQFKTPANTVVECAFLPPEVEQEENIIQSYDRSTIVFLCSHFPLLIACAYRPRIQGIDLYGIELCVDTAKNLLKNYPNLGLLLAISDMEPGSSDFTRLHASILQRNLSGNVHVMVTDAEVWPLFKRADLMLRPSLKDGSSISIAEALYFHCPVLASDVCERGKDVVIFKSGDILDLTSKAEQILASRLGKVTQIFDRNYNFTSINSQYVRRYKSHRDCEKQGSLTLLTGFEANRLPRSEGFCHSESN